MAIKRWWSNSLKRSDGTDTATDKATETATNDMATDTATESVTVTATDTASDTATDTTTDTVADTATDTATDRATDTATDTVTDTETDRIARSVLVKKSLVVVAGKVSCQKSPTRFTILKCDEGVPTWTHDLDTAPLSALLVPFE